MDKEIEGTIISNQLGVFGKDDIIYGYIGVKQSNGNQMKIKVDNYTEYDTLDIGAEVIIEIDKLGTTDIIVARKIIKKDKMNASPEQATVNA